MASEQEKLKTSQSELKTVCVTDAHAGLRLDLFLAKTLLDVSRSKIKTWFDAGTVTLNAQFAKPRDLVKTGDLVAYRSVPAAPSHLQPVAWPLSILYEDEHLIVVDKPAGLAVHPGAGVHGATLVQALLHHAGQLSRMAELEGRDAQACLRPGIVHRLDKDTSGVMVVAKTDAAHAHLARQFHDKTNLREYLALLDGVLPEGEMLHESYLYRDPHARLRFASLSPSDYEKLKTTHPTEGSGKRYRYARSVFKREAVFAERLSLARVRLFTGRTHQIRVHALDLRLPIVGDLVYHRPTVLPQSFAAHVRRVVVTVARQLLHAAVLGFQHPKTGLEMRFEATYPADFKAVMNALEEYRQI